MDINPTLRYGLDWDKDYLIDLSMQFQLYAPIVSLLTIHPLVQYLLIFDTKMMKKDLRMLYILTHLAFILNELVFSSALRIYPAVPIAALYCERPLCRMGLNKQALMVMLSTPVILVITTFLPLSVNMHQLVIPVDSNRRLTTKQQTLLNASLNTILIANVLGWGYFGRDHDNSEQLRLLPELSWLSERGGTIFLYGPPGDPQYFKWELLFLAISIVIVAPFLIEFTFDAMSNLSKTSSKFLSGYTQAMARRMFHMFLVQCIGVIVCFVLPLTYMLSFMLVNPTFFPGWVCALLRISLLTLFNIHGYQFCIFFILRSPVYRKIVRRKFKELVDRCLGVNTSERSVNSSINTMHAISIRIEQF